MNGKRFSIHLGSLIYVTQIERRVLMRMSAVKMSLVSRTKEVEICTTLECEA